MNEKNLPTRRELTEENGFIQPDMRPVTAHSYQLYCDYKITVIIDNTEYRFRIPSGLTTDGVSSPRLFWSVRELRPDGLTRAAALIHDVVYATGGKIPAPFCECSLGSDHIISRKEGDVLFLELMRRAGVGKVSRWYAYTGVRLWGWNYYGKRDEHGVKDFLTTQAKIHGTQSN